MSLSIAKAKSRNRALLSGLLLTAANLTSAVAAPVFHWSGTTTNYLQQDKTGHFNLPLTQADDDPKVWQRLYSDSVAISPAAVDGSGAFYGGPLFYGAAWMSSSDGSLTSFARMYIRRPASYYQNALEIGLPADTSTEGGAFLFFKKESFVGYDEGASYGIDGTSSLSARFSGVTRSTVRLAILNEGQWYLSSDTVPTGSTGSSIDFASGQLSTSLWGEWDPTGGLEGRLDNAPSVFDTLTGSFQNIEAIGIYGQFDTATGAQYFYTTDFEANFQVIPEPGLAYLLMAGAPVYWFLRMRRKKAWVASSARL